MQIHTQGVIIPTTPEQLAELIRNSVTEAVAHILKPPAPDRYLSRAEVAAELGVSKVTVWKATREGRLKAHRIGARVLYKHSEVLAALAGPERPAKRKGGQNA
jgi:excisionase family DNA binding protein